MNILFEIISNVDRRVISHLEKKIKAEFAQNDTILFRIFTAYKKQIGNEKVDEKIIREQVYRNRSSGVSSYYRMKNRLVDIINIYLADYETGGISSADISNYINLHQIFAKKGIFKLAKYYLDKAEKIAVSNEQYEYLDIIYGHYIQLGKETMYTDPAIYIQRRQENSNMLTKIREIDDILAVVSYRLKSTQNLGGKLNISKEVNRAINNFSSDKDLLSSVQFQIKMYKAVSQILVQQKEYKELQKYLQTTFDEFSEAKIFGKNTHEIKVEMLIYLTNALLSQKKYNEALSFSEKLHDALLQYDKLLYKKYIMFYYQARVPAYSVIDVDKAIDTIKEIITDKNIVTNPYYVILNYSNLAYLYYGKGAYNQVIKSLQKIYLHDFYIKADQALKAPLAILELITRIDMDDLDSFEYRLPQVKNQFENDWSSFEGPERTVLELIEEIGSDSGFLKKKKLRTKAEEFIKAGNGNTELFNYERWLTSKFKLNY